MQGFGASLMRQGRQCTQMDSEVQCLLRLTTVIFVPTAYHRQYEEETTAHATRTDFSCTAQLSGQLRKASCPQRQPGAGEVHVSLGGRLTQDPASVTDHRAVLGETAPLSELL